MSAINRRAAFEGPHRTGVRRVDRSAGPAISDEDWRSVEATLGLSSREGDIVRGLFDGKKARGIAQDLGVSPCTIRTHLGRMYRKLEVPNHAALLLCVFSAYLSCRSTNGEAHSTDP